MPPFFMDFEPKQPTAYCFVEGPADEVRFGVDPQTAGEELDRIRERDGTIQPPAVVDEARPEGSPLHPAFEWQDPVAAERYRLIQATTLIKQVRVMCPEPVQSDVFKARMDPASMPIEPALTAHDPLAHDLSKTVGSLVETRRQITELKLKAARRFDRKKVIAAEVALAELEEAEENLNLAYEALTAGRKAAEWSGR